jgi:exopolysaccharide biosynthesis polyprenyl glycosylphosphotransferase
VRSEAIAQTSIAGGNGISSFRDSTEAYPSAGSTAPEIAVISPPAEAYTAPRRSPDTGRSHGNPLRRILVALDLVSFAVAWAIGILLPMHILGDRAAGWAGLTLQIAIGVAAGVGAMAVQRLYLARVCSIRADELSRTARAAVASAVVVALVSAIFDSELSVQRAVVSASLAFLLAGGLRGVYGSMLRERRARGLNRRPIIIVGTNREAQDLAELVATHPEFGYEPVGVVGDRTEFDGWATALPYLGDVDRTSDVAVGASANGVLIAASALDPSQLKHLTRELVHTDLHVHLSSGLWGIDHRRLRSVPVAHEPIFYLEKISLSRWNKAVKRSADIVIAGVALLVAAPVMLIAALAVKLQDGGSVLFRQVRVGKDGKHFHVFKLRTMVPNAEEMVADLREQSNFRDGPLFKMEKDPRQTKVGRILEAASIDELPQLLNVLQGTMSLVGPRPALPSEAAQFDEELQERFSVPPGITGLWQVEARDNPSFSAYRRLDLFYVENWSITLDIAILFETASSVVSRIFRGLR